MPLLGISLSTFKGRDPSLWGNGRDAGMLGSGPCPDALWPGGQGKSLNPRPVERGKRQHHLPLELLESQAP